MDAAHKLINEELDGLLRGKEEAVKRAIEPRDLAETAVDLRQEVRRLKAEAVHGASHVLDLLGGAGSA